MTATSENEMEGRRNGTIKEFMAVQENYAHKCRRISRGYLSKLRRRRQKYSDHQREDIVVKFAAQINKMDRNCILKCSENLAINQQHSTHSVNLFTYPPASFEPHPHARVVASSQDCPMDSSDQNQTQRKSKRSRTAFSAYQINELEFEYKRSTYMHRPQRVHIAQRLSLNERVVKIWFQNRRTKDKKLKKSTLNKKPKSKPQTEQTVQQEIVQRLMSYSDPSIQLPEASPFYSNLRSGQPAALPPPPPPPTQITPPPTPATMNTGIPELSEILHFLEGTSTSQTPCNNTPSQAFHPYDLDMIIQTIRSDLKQESNHWMHSQQQAMTTTPTINLSWGEPPYPQNNSKAF